MIGTAVPIAVVTHMHTQTSSSTCTQTHTGSHYAFNVCCVSLPNIIYEIKYLPEGSSTIGFRTVDGRVCVLPNRTAWMISAGCHQAPGALRECPLENADSKQANGFNRFSGVPRLIRQKVSIFTRAAIRERPSRARAHVSACMCVCTMGYDTHGVI